MTNSIERFALRQALRAQRSAGSQLIPMPSSADAQRLFAAPVDHAYLEGLALAAPLLSPPITISAETIAARLSGLEEAFHAERVSRLFAETRQSTLQSVAVTFGVGKILSAYDKAGGSVDTIHNARAGVYATDEAQKAYLDRGEYNTYDYHQKDQRYAETNRKATKDRLAGNLSDTYTGDLLGLEESQSLDHTIAAEWIHKDRGRVLAGKDGPTLANEASNLNPTTKTTNSAMQQKSASEYIAWLEENKPARDARLAELHAQKATGEPLRKDLAQELAKLTEQDKISNNPEPLLAADRKARADYEKEINTYYSSPQFRSDCLKTSAKAGGRAAFQAAVGAVLVEAFAGIWDEIRDWYVHGAQEETVATELKRRIKRVGVRVAKQWKGVLAAGAGGFISGFLANLLTVLINTFITTAKRTARMIREGASSLLTACRTVLVRPEGMTLAEGFHEASKVLVGGAIVVGGVVLEETISLQLKAIPVILPFADLATAVIVGATTALTSTIAVYMVDKADMFGVNRGRLMELMNSELDLALQQQESHRTHLIEQLQAHQAQLV
ncbi:MAG: hypothetical protein ACRESJ_14990 [Pseudomonas sp.]|uniref:hypothetical protein n=1 Tax=Pseudomonas sp. TaxID=306 RepID=UPI003D6E10DC